MTVVLFGTKLLKTHTLLRVEVIVLEIIVLAVNCVEYPTIVAIPDRARVFEKPSRDWRRDKYSIPAR